MVIFIRTLIFIIILFLIIIVIVTNFGLYIFSLKVFNNNFFGDWELVFSIWRVLFMFIVLIIRIRVLIFSFSYIEGLIVTNFILLYLSFVVRIIWLILNNNFYWIIFGWDGLGVVSFLLIVFYMNVERINNGLFTIFQNRIGDLFFVLFIVGLIRIVMSTNLILLFGVLFLVLGSTVKRAQFPFNAWLLSAIRAPTPISSLVHSSTLVVAGVYILLQYSYCLFEFIEVLRWISILTLFLRLFGLINESDLKKIIAYSTINHVALIIYLFSFNLFKIVYFHLNIHAMFKSLIFMCFGFVILASFHTQDKRLVRLRILNPLIKVIYSFSCLCLAGLPFLSAFFSKDLIIENIIVNLLEFFFVFLLILFLGVRAYYRLKLIIIFNRFLAYQILTLNKIRVFRVIIIIVLRIFIVNLYLSLVISIRLQILSYKLSIYLVIITFLLLSFLRNLNYKFIIYEKSKRFYEVFNLNYYRLDQFFFFRIIFILRISNRVRIVKLFLLSNWWFLLILVILW